MERQSGEMVSSDTFLSWLQCLPCKLLIPYLGEQSTLGVSEKNRGIGGCNTVLPCSHDGVCRRLKEHGHPDALALLDG